MSRMRDIIVAIIGGLVGLIVSNIDKIKQPVMHFIAKTFSVSEEYLTSGEHLLSLVYAVVFAIVIWLIDKKYLQRDRGISPSEKAKAADKPEVVFQQSGKDITEEEIKRSLRINKPFSHGSLKKLMVDAINKEKCLVRKHHCDASGIFHGEYMLNLSKLLDDTSFRELMKRLGKTVNLNGIDFVLYCNRSNGGSPDSNVIFSQKIVGETTRVRTAGLSCGRERIFDILEPGDIEGKSVILIESLLCYPKSACDTIVAIKACKANLMKYVIFLNGTVKGTVDQFDPVTCGLRAEDVIIGGSIDLGIKPRGNCESCKSIDGSRTADKP